MFAGLAEYFRTHRRSVIFMYVLAFSCYGIWLSRDYVTFDAEGFYTSGLAAKWYSQWIGLERWGLVLLKYLFGTLTVNPFFSSAVFFLCMPMSALLWNALAAQWLLETGRKYAPYIFGLIFLTHPVWTLQYAYRNQMECIAFLHMILPLAMLCYTRFLREGSLTDLASAFLMCVLCMGSYQSFVFMAADAFCIILFLWLHEKEDDRADWKRILISVLFLVLAFVCSILIARACISAWKTETETDYLISQMMWKTRPVSESVSVILSCMHDAVLGGNDVFTPLYAIVSAISLAALIIRTRSRIIPKTVMFLCIFLIPFALEIFTASDTVIRSRFSFVLSLAFFAMYAAYAAADLRAPLLKACVIAPVLIFGISQIGVSSRLQYTDVSVREEDRMKFHDIWLEAQHKGAEEGDAIWFIGWQENLKNDAMLEKEVIGYSYFEYTSFYHPGKVIDAMKAYGYDVSMPSAFQIEKAESSAGEMGVWPLSDEGIRVEDHLVTVRLK